jgi:predicted transport protein
LRVRLATLETALTNVLSTAERLKAAGAAGNEANTRALLIDPILAALGWDLFNIDEVEREFRVYDGSFLDYALRVSGKPKLFVEAKAMNKNLADRAFIGQTVNYANNEGVLWCVLTNGLTYQVYKSNEPVPMERKLLFEVNLRDAAEEGGRSDVIRSLRVLGKSSVSDGQLDAWGEQVFIDVRTRAALAKLGREPSQGFIRAVSAAVEGTPIETARLRTSLARILGQELAIPPAEPVVGSPPPARPAPAVPPAPPGTQEDKGGRERKTYELGHHLARKPSAIIDLFERLHAMATGFGPDVTHRPTKWYIGYYAGKRSFMTAELQQAKILVYLSIPPVEAKPWNEAWMRDASHIGHFGMGDTEFSLREPSQLSDLEQLGRHSYLRNRR